MTIYYGVIFVISIICSGIYIFQWKKNYSVFYTLTFVLIPLANMGYLMMSLARNEGEALLALKIMYIGGCYLLMIIMFYVIELCHISISRYISLIFVIINSIIYASILCIGYFPLFYKDTVYTVRNGIVSLERHYAPMHTVFYTMTILEFVISIAALIYAFRNKREASRWSIKLLLMTQTASIFAFFYERFADTGFEWLPAVYVMDQVVYLIIANRTMLYDVDGTVEESIEDQGTIGFASFGFAYDYLGCNEAAHRFLPVLSRMRVDDRLRDSGDEAEILGWLKAFKENEGNNENNNGNGNEEIILSNNEKKNIYDKEAGGKYNRFQIGNLCDGKKKVGYQIMMTDVTQEQKYLNLLNNYNTDLKEEVEQKTEHIQMLQDSMVMGMATMVESRDNSTGGHIRRTSDVVKILMEEIMNENIWKIDKTFRKNMIKAAPMHDLGKIAVDDDILKKPGRFTNEEFEKMKAHAAEGARVVSKILADIDDEEFRILAVNVAHYHHERWDGSGYPKGLSKEDIPLEARIMAVADVYDALVSKRCYKDSMSFDEAKKIILDGMGKHFDERLKKPFMSSVKRLEEYYSKADK